MKYENLTLEIKKISGSLTTYLYSSQSSQRKEWLLELCKISRKYRLNQKLLKTGAKMSTIVRKFLGYDP